LSGNLIPGESASIRIGRSAEARPRSVLVLRFRSKENLRLTSFDVCLIGNTALELGANDTEIIDRGVGLDLLKGCFKRALELPLSDGTRRTELEVQ
jgi:hypothetical protein